MMRFKSKVVCAFLVAVLTLSLVPTFLFAGYGPPATVNLTLRSVEGVGELTLTVSTDFATGYGLNSFNFHVTYDDQYLTFRSGSFGAGANYDDMLSVIETGTGTTVAGDPYNYVGVIGAMDDPDSPAWRGDVLTIVFDVSDYAEPGVTTFPFTAVVTAAECWWTGDAVDVAAIAPATYNRTYEGPPVNPPASVGVSFLPGRTVFGDRRAVYVRVTNTTPDTTLPADAYVMVMTQGAGAGGPVMTFPIPVGAPIPSGEYVDVRMGIHVAPNTGVTAIVLNEAPPADVAFGGGLFVVGGSTVGLASDFVR